MCHIRTHIPGDPMSKHVTIYYSRANGRRVGEAFAKRKPTWVNTLTLDPNFLRGKNFKVASDGMPTNWHEAEKARYAWNDYQDVLRRRREKARQKREASLRIVNEVNRTLSKMAPTDKKAAAKTTVDNVTRATVKKGQTKAKKLAQPLPAIPAPLI